MSAEMLDLILDQNGRPTEENGSYVFCIPGLFC